MSDHCQCPACKDGVLHKSDCAVHNEPAEPLGPCTCKTVIQVKATWESKHDIEVPTINLASKDFDITEHFDDNMTPQNAELIDWDVPVVSKWLWGTL